MTGEEGEMNYPFWESTQISLHSEEEHAPYFAQRHKSA